MLIQTIFLLSIFAEIFVTTQRQPFGTKTLTYLIFQRVLESQNVGLGSAGGVYAIILANIVALFLMRIVGKNLGRVRKRLHGTFAPTLQSQDPELPLLHGAIGLLIFLPDPTGQS